MFLKTNPASNYVISGSRACLTMLLLQSAKMMMESVVFKCPGADSPFSQTPGTRRRALARDPSSENLFVDIGAQPECRQSDARQERQVIPSHQTCCIHLSANICMIGFV